MLICWDETATCCGKNIKKTEEINVFRRKQRLLSCLSVFVHYSWMQSMTFVSWSSLLS
ncbi:hypothetical protein GQ55_3G449300 [Panicum hallii var. hallii]|uniref:Uncharacterized protein n=1 Tax=Panicum hallii var. hallii TaxID=1504633 RepID=A0A2T7EIE4_9POAL|nr:hypothetical protein GQ55_3G449300 [Panicum hallii var. hallii]